MVQYKYGEREINGESIDISQVPQRRSEREKYICPVCKAPFFAAIGENNAPHFRHKGVFCKVADVHQTALHMRAKEIIQKEKKFFLPPYVVHLEDLLEDPEFKTFPPWLLDQLPQEYIYQPETMLQCPDVALEKRISNIVPDVVAYTPQGPYLIEIFVTNKVTGEKIEKAAKIGYPLLEVVLDDLKDETISEDRLKGIIIESWERTRWRYYPDEEKAIAAAREFYLSRLKEINYRRQQETKRRQKAEKDKQQGQARPEPAKKEPSERLPKDVVDRLLSLNKGDFDSNIAIYDGNRERPRRIYKCVRCEKISYGPEMAKVAITLQGRTYNNKGICKRCMTT